MTGGSQTDLSSLEARQDTKSLETGPEDGEITCIRYPFACGEFSVEMNLIGKTFNKSFFQVISDLVLKKNFRLNNVNYGFFKLKNI